MQNILLALLGGLFIGAASSLMLILNGRVMGVSGIVNAVLGKVSVENLWRVGFLAGLIMGGFVLREVYPPFFKEPERAIGIVILAGLLVGYGTVMGSGCTSGHGICGISRLSKRSLVATVVFIATGVLTATLFKIFAGA